jgi:phenylacetate-CoA ligase
MRFPLDDVNAALERVSRHPFHAGRLPTRVADAEEFAAAVPLMSREDLVAEMRKPGFGAFACPEAVRMNFSPMGGGLVPVLHTRDDLERIHAACGTQIAACGLGPGDVCAVTFGYHLFVAGLFYQSQMEAAGIACIPAGPGETERTAQICRDAGVTVLAGNPGFALRLLEAGMPAPKVFYAGGEPFTGNRTLYEAVRAAMPDTLLIDSFSLSEALPVARTFPGGEGVHLFDELLYAEAIDPHTGEVLPDGERGELVLTHLHKRAQPLVRYRTGDLTVLRRTEPVHGRTVNLPRVVFGRTDAMVKAKGVKLYPSELRAVLLGEPGVDGGHRLEVTAEGGRDRLALTVEGRLDEEAEARIRRAFKSQTLVSLDALEAVERLEEGPALVDKR